YRATPIAFAALSQYACRSGVGVVWIQSEIYDCHPERLPVFRPALTESEHCEVRNHAPDPKSYSPFAVNSARIPLGSLPADASSSCRPERLCAYLRLNSGDCMFRVPWPGTPEK
ncbi:MAG: hypothetical protein LQ338_003459, partial [Usnochroma carphineum]